MGRCRRRISSVLTSRSFARIRFEIVLRFSVKRPFLVFAQMCVKPRKSNVSGRPRARALRSRRSEEHTSELQSHLNLVCRLLLEKKKKKKKVRKNKKEYVTFRRVAA